MSPRQPDDDIPRMNGTDYLVIAIIALILGATLAIGWVLA